MDLNSFPTLVTFNAPFDKNGIEQGNKNYNTFHTGLYFVCLFLEEMNSLLWDIQTNTKFTLKLRALFNDRSLLIKIFTYSYSKFKSFLV